MIIRELVALLRFKSDGSLGGVEREVNHAKEAMEKASVAAERFREVLSEISIIFGLGIGIHEVAELSDEWVQAAGRVGLVTKSIDEQKESMASLQKIAEDTGASMESLANLFVNFKNAQKEVNATNPQILRAIQTASEVMAQGTTDVGHMHRTIMQLDQILSTGQFNKQHLRELTRDNPAVVQFLSNQVGGRAELYKMVEGKKFDGKELFKVLLDGAALADSQFKNLGETFARARAQIKNIFGGLVYEIQTSTGIFTAMARAMVFSVRWLKNEIEDVKDALGGWTNTLELIGILFAAAFGPRLILMLGRVISMLRTMVVVNGLATWEFIAIAAAVVLVGLAIQDVIGWTKGLHSVTGDLLGPFKGWKIYIDEAKAAVAGFFERLMGVKIIGASVHYIVDFVKAIRAVFSAAWGAITGYDWHGAGKKIEDTFRALFPAGTSTGAPLLAIFRGIWIALQWVGNAFIWVLTQADKVLNWLINNKATEKWWFTKMIDMAVDSVQSLLGVLKLVNDGVEIVYGGLSKAATVAASVGSSTWDFVKNVAVPTVAPIVSSVVKHAPQDLMAEAFANQGPAPVNDNFNSRPANQAPASVNDNFNSRPANSNLAVKLPPDNPFGPMSQVANGTDPLGKNRSGGWPDSTGNVTTPTPLLPTRAPVEIQLVPIMPATTPASVFNQPNNTVHHTTNTVHNDITTNINTNDNPASIARAANSGVTKATNPSSNLGRSLTIAQPGAELGVSR